MHSDDRAPAAATDDLRVPLTPAEDRVLRLLGAAVIDLWNLLPTPLQRDLFTAAAAQGQAAEAPALKQRIARFLHDHKDDDRGILG